MEEGTPEFEEETTSIIKIEDMTLEEAQLAEQLYYNAGLDPIVDAGIKDYDKKIQQEDKLISKVFGVRGSDIRGYGESVARRVAFAVYGLLNRQYGGKMGDLRSYVMSLEDERNHANTRYDDLMGRVIGILGDEYKELRTDSKEFIEKLTKTLGDDLKEAKIDQEALAARLADIDGLRAQISTLNKEKEQLKEKHETQLVELKGEHKEEVRNLKSQMDSLNEEIKHLNTNHEAQIAELNSRIAGLESDKNALTGDLEQLKKEYNELKTAIENLSESIPSEEMKKRLGEDIYGFLLKDSKVPDAVLKGVGQFIDFRKYLGLAVENGAKEVRTHIEQILGTTSNE
jgi:outer membrane murein-binding lipoprotein Lpp